MNQRAQELHLGPRGAISIYANDGGVPFNLDMQRNIGLNSRYQFVLSTRSAGTESPRLP
jgi:hypothetical protein